MSKFNTIIADDWRRAIARGRAEGNQVLSQIRAKVRELNYQRAAQGFCDFPGVEQASPAAKFPMNNPDNQITEAQVASFLQAKAVELSQAAGNEYARVRMEVTCYGKPTGECRLSAEAYINPGIFAESKALEESIANALRLAEPSAKAAKMRADAAKLLADAAKLEGVAV